MKVFLQRSENVGAMQPRVLATALLALGAFAASGATIGCAESALSIVPKPLELTRDPGTFALPARVSIVARGTEARRTASLLARGLRALHVSAEAGDSAAATIRLSLDARDPALGSEGYRLDINENGVTLRANGGAGLFYAAQTLEQIVDGAGDAPRGLPFVRIVDAPAYRWRGIHLDVSRHFFAVPVVERYIDLAARYKLNVFHWHLTDDQGWRMPVPRYPKLATIGGCRAGTQVGGEGSTRVDGRRYCGSYSEAQIREVVAYAGARYVRVVPEIEMPGHSVEALAAYPWLACRPGRYAVRELWGISNDIFCPTERTFAFLDDVLREVAALFPGPYVHVGGDEVPKDAWRGSAAVDSLRRRERLSSLDAVGGYFTRRVERIAAKYGRRIVGWDEILDGGVTRGATVMAWQSAERGVRAARRGNDVVMTPDGVLYLDAYQGLRDEPLAIGGFTPLRTVYGFEPAPPELTPALARHVLGAQANLWTEYIPNPAQLFYMLLPRELALAEIAWTPRRLRDYDDFVARLGPQLGRLEREGIAFRIPDVAFRVRDYGADGHTATVELNEAASDATVRYSLDGTVPTGTSAAYAGPLSVRLDAATVRIGAVAVLPGGRRSAPSFFDLAPR